MGSGELGEFLRARRAQRTPEDAGVTYSGRRKVAGLRREEVAVRLSEIDGADSVVLRRSEEVR